MKKPTFIIDGAKFSSLDEFARYFSDLLLQDYEWDGDMNAFNDILRGGFGTPEDGFVLRWERSALSRERLGHTTFDTIIEIIEDHGVGGRQHEDGVELVLL